MAITQFFDLTIWKQAHQLAIEVYALTARFPVSEKYGVISQLQRASSSVSANIAEGCGRYSFKDKAWFLHIARGSVTEVQNFLFLARDLKYLSETETSELVERYTALHKGINGFIRALNKKAAIS